MGNLFKAHIFKERTKGPREEVKIKLFNLDGSPADVGGGAGGGPTQYIEGNNLQRHVQGTNWFAYFDGTEEGIDIVGFDMTGEQAIELPSGIYTSTWQWGFDPSADDGVADTVRGFSAQIQPLGKQLEDYVQKPAGGWADVSPYMRALGYNFVIPADGNDLIVALDASTSDETDVTFYLNFLLMRLGDIPA